jgi:hypothetical protein
MRDKRKALGLAEILTGHGWLIANQAPHRRDRREWRIIRGLNGYPTSATTPPAPLQSD